MTPVPMRFFWPLVILVSGYSAYGSRVKNVNPSASSRPGTLLAADDLTGEAAEESGVEYVRNGSLEPLYEFLIEQRLHKLCKLLREANLEDILLGTGTLTIFAPTDGSFVFLPGGTLEEIRRNPQWLRDFVLHHIVAGDIRSQQIQDEMFVTSLQGSPLRFNIYGSGQVYTVSGAQILTFDLPFELGRLHIIDHPLYPIQEGNIVSYLQPTHSYFYRLLLSTGLAEILSGGTYTVFAPDDRAFSYLSQDFLDILNQNRTLAERIILNHVLHGSVYTKGITNGMQMESVGGSQLTFTENRGLTFVNGVPIILPDVPVTNGVVHVINRVLLPEGIDTDCHCKSSRTGTVSRPASGQDGFTGSQVSYRQPQGPGASEIPYRSGRPQAPGAPIDTGTGLRPGSLPAVQQPQRPGRPGVGGQVPRPGTPATGIQTPRPGSPHGGSARPGSSGPGIAPGRESSQEPFPTGQVAGGNLPQDQETHRLPGDTSDAGQPDRPGTTFGTGQTQRPGSTYGTRPQTPGSVLGTGPAQRPGSSVGPQQPVTSGSPHGSRLPQRPGTAFGTGQPQIPSVAFETDQTPGSASGPGQPQTPGSTFGTGSPQRPGTPFGTGQPQSPGSTFGTGQGRRPTSHVTKGQALRPGQGQGTGSIPTSRYPQRPGSSAAEPQQPGGAILPGLPQRPGSSVETELPQSPGGSLVPGQPHRPGSSLVPGRPQRPGSVFGDGYPENTVESEQPQIPGGTFETGQPQRVGSPSGSGRTPSQSDTPRYPGSQQRGTPVASGPLPDDIPQVNGSPVRGPPPGVPHGSRYPIPGPQSRVTPALRPQVTARYPGSPQDSVAEVPTQSFQPDRPDSRKQPATQRPQTQPGRPRTPQTTGSLTPRPVQLPPTQRPPVGQIRPVPTTRPIHSPISETTNCRQPGDRITSFNRNLPPCSAQDIDQEPCQSVDQPYDPSDSRPPCPGSDLSQGCRHPLQPPAANDRRPACRITQTKPNCRKPNEPLDNRPLCPDSSRSCRLPEEPQDPLNPLPLCQDVLAIGGCKRPGDPYTPNDRRPDCPPDDCRQPQEPSQPGDTRPLCPVNEVDSIRQPLVPTTARPRYPQQPRPGSQPQTPGTDRSRPGGQPDQSRPPVGSRPQAPSWQRPQPQPSLPRQPIRTESVTTRKPGKQPQDTPSSPSSFVQPASPDDNEALTSPVANPPGRPTYPGSSPSTRPQGRPPSGQVPSRPQTAGHETAVVQPEGQDQSRPGRPYPTGQRPSGQSGITQTPGPQRPPSQGGLPQSSPRRPPSPSGGPYPQQRPPAGPQTPSGGPYPQQRPPAGPQTPSGGPYPQQRPPAGPQTPSEGPYPQQRPPSGPQPPRVSHQPSGSPGSPSAGGGGDDSARSLLDITRDPGLLIKGHPVKLTIILDLFERAGLVDILEGPGPATAFLPSDDAFKKLPQGVVDQLAENPELLRQVLLYHIIAREIRPSSQETSFIVPTRQGMSLVITMLNGGRLILIGGAKAVAVTRASNGIFYVVNELLYPLPHEDIVSALKTRPDLTQITSLVQQSGLTNMLTGSTPFTLFAPTDAAFQSLPESFLHGLTQNSTAIRELLLGHVVEGAHFGREFLSGGVFPNARGGKLRFKVLSFGYTVNDANIKPPEIVTGTGVIHLVDQVLLEPNDLNAVQGELPNARPQGESPNVRLQGESPNVRLQGESPNVRPTGDVNVVRVNDVSGNYENYQEITDLAKGMGLNKFLSWITNTGLIQQVHDGGSYTILAPTDQAVNSLPGNMVQGIDSDPDQVRPLLKFHIITQHIDPNNIRNEQTVSTLLPEKRIRFNVYQNGQVITACGVPLTQVQGSGSVKLVAVDQALYPPSGNLVQVLEASPILKNLAETIRKYHLSWMLVGQGPTTIFAPSDAAFKALSEEDKKKLIEDRQAFTDLLKRHIVKGTIFSAGMQDGTQVRNEKKENLTFSVHPSGISVNSIPVSYSDVTATNGVLHVIDHFL